jgi:hypothetical protein
LFLAAQFKVQFPVIVFVYIQFFLLFSLVLLFFYRHFSYAFHDAYFYYMVGVVFCFSEWVFLRLSLGVYYKLYLPNEAFIYPWYHTFILYTLRAMCDLGLGVWKYICPKIFKFFLQMFMLLCRIWLIYNCGLLSIDKFKILNTWSQN